MWYFLDSEESFDQLYDSLNMKGVRERKLLEGLKKIRYSTKMKKSKKPASAQKPEEENVNTSAKPVDEEKQDVEMKPVDEENNQAENSDDADAKDQGNLQHHVFENDDFEQTIIDVVWFSKYMPKRRRADNLTGKKESSIGLDAVKIQLLEIESLYSSTMGNLNREWESPAVREQILTTI